MSGLQRAIRIIACLWLVSFFSALPFSYYTGVHYLEYPPNSSNSTLLLESAFCGMLSQPEWIPLTETSTMFFFIIPMFAIAVQYIKMGIEISKTTKKTLGKGIKGSVHRDSRKAQSNRSVIRMLSAVVVGFFVCWAPFHAQRLLVTYCWSCASINTWMFFVTGVFYYFSSTLNPILYNVMSDRMRNAFKEVLFGIKPKRGIRRTSTFRDTYSKSYNYNIRVQKSPNTVETIMDDLEDDKSTMVNQEIVSLSIPTSGNTLFYEIHLTNNQNHFKDNKDRNCNNETNF